MEKDQNSGVQIKRNYSYYTYQKNIDGESCSDITGFTSQNKYNGEYIILYKNSNENYYSDINDELLTLNISGITDIDTWYDNYINSIASTGYTGILQSERENRVIYDSNGDYYKVDHLITGNTSSEEMFAIYDTVNSELWATGSTPYFYNILDNCGNQTGRSAVSMIDINPFSSSYGYFRNIERCIPKKDRVIVTTNEATLIQPTQATLNSVIEQYGNSQLIECGFYYGIYSNPDEEDLLTTTGSTYQSYSVTVANLIKNKTYYARAYAKDSYGTVYGNEITFKTLNS